MSYGLLDILWFIVALGVLISVHEFGHFWVARRLGFKVLRFAVGFGRPNLSRHGADGVEYALGAIPLGGYVKLVDEREGPVAPEDLPRSFTRRPVWQRVAVLVAGAGANLAFAVLLAFVLYLHGVPGTRAVVGPVTAGSLAATAGLASGDELVGVGERAVATREAAVLEIITRVTDDGAIPLRVRRGGEERRVVLEVPAERRRALTVPGAWESGLGFRFTDPTLPPVLASVVPDGAAAAAGLRAGDEVVAIDGRSIADYAALREYVRARPGATLTFTVRRPGGTVSLPVVTRAVREGAAAAPVGQIGVASGGGATFPPEMRTLERYGPLAAAGHALTSTADKTLLTVRLLWRMVTGHVSLKNVSGPISIATFAGASARAGLPYYLDFLAIISISLAVLNLMPVPVLDGGQIVYQLAEGIRGRPLPERVAVLGQQVGIVLLILLMGLAFYNDIGLWRFG